MSLVAVARNKMATGVEAPGFRFGTYDWREPSGSEANLGARPKDPAAKRRGIVAALELHDLGNALDTVWDEDAHFVTYVVRERGTPLVRQPRVNKGGLAWMREQGYELSAEVFAADVDNPGHGPWTPALRAEFEDKISRSAVLSTAGIYITAHGWRPIQPLAHPLPVDAFENALGGWLIALEREGIEPDSSCRDWTRMYRLPSVRRDGRIQRGEIFLDRMRPIDPPAAKAIGRAGRGGRGKPRRPDGVVPVAELPPTWIERITPIASELMVGGGYKGQRHEISLALGGALLGRRVPPEYVPAIVRAVMLEAGWNEVAGTKNTEDTVAKWAAGAKVKGAHWLSEAAPRVLDAIDGVIDAGGRRAAAEAAPVVTETLSAVTERLDGVIGAATAGLVLVKAACGIGKTIAAHAVAEQRSKATHKSAGTHVRAPLHSKTAISAPTTKLAKEQVEKLRARGLPVLRLFGVSSEGEVDPECRFAAAGKLLANGGQSIPWEFCEGRGKKRCEHADTCTAYGGRVGPDDARVAVGPHSMVAELSAWAGTTGLLVIDEPPELLVTEVIRLEDLEMARANLYRFEARYAAAMAPALASVEAWLEHGVEDYVGPLDVAFEAGANADLAETAMRVTGALTTIEAVEAAFEPGVRSKAPPIRVGELATARTVVARAKLLGEASRVLGAIYRSLVTEGAVVRVEVRARRGKEPETVLICTWAKEELEEALRRDGATVVLDAGADIHAPIMAKVVGYEPPIHVFAAADGAPVERTLIRTSSATRAAWLPNWRISVERIAVAVRAAIDWVTEIPGDVGIITFLPVELALRAARGEEVREKWSKASQKPEDLALAKVALGPELARLGGRRVELGHYGAMRGLDGWKDLDALVTLGDPWRNLGDVQHEVDFLGLGGTWEDRVEAQGRAELEQAHGRLRTIHRTRPGRQLHVGALVPSGWSSWATRRPSEGRPTNVPAIGVEGLRELVRTLGGPTLASEAGGCSRAALARYLGGERAAPPALVVELRRLAVLRPETSPKALLENSPNSAFGDTTPANASCHATPTTRNEASAPNRAFGDTDEVALVDDADDFEPEAAE